ncbi:unnamed protein product [Boreogadus saida]
MVNANHIVSQGRSDMSAGKSARAVLGSLTQNTTLGAGTGTLGGRVTDHMSSDLAYVPASTTSGMSFYICLM